MAEKFPCFNFFPRDWIAGTATLSPFERGVFIHLLCYAWEQNPPCTLPDDDAALASLSGCTPAEWRKIREKIRKKFSTVDGGLLVNPKQARIYDEMVKLRQKRRSGGQQGARVRWDSYSPPIAEPLANGCLPVPYPVPEEEKKKRTTDVVPKKESAKRGTQLPEAFRPNETHRRLAAKNGVDLHDEFEHFCDHWRAKGGVFKDWDAALRTWLRNAKKFQKTSPPIGSEASQVRTENPGRGRTAGGELRADIIDINNPPWRTVGETEEQFRARKRAQ